MKLERSCRRPARPPGLRRRIDITGITADFAPVRPGMILFVAAAGSRPTARALRPTRSARGAVGVVAAPRSRQPAARRAPLFAVDDPRRALALIAARLLPAASRKPWSRSPAPAARPRSPLSRGRSGSRRDTRRPASAPPASSRPAATIWLAHHARSGRAAPPARRTRGAPASTHAAMEASSHGLDQRRLDGVRLAAGGFTNLGRDHMDYHPTVEDYLAPSSGCSTRCCPRARRRSIFADDAGPSRYGDEAAATARPERAHRRPARRWVPHAQAGRA